MATPRIPVQRRLAKRLRALRKQKGISQMDMVRDHGWSLSHYQKMERGVLDPRMTTLEALAKSFGLTLGGFLKGM